MINNQKAKKTYKLREMLCTNKDQTAYYELPLDKKGNLITRLWLTLHLNMDKIIKSIGINETVHDLHRRWLGDLSEKRVLDLGCYTGNKLSLSIAENSQSYLGIDLSGPAIDQLRRKLKEKRLVHADAKVVDFLSPEFTDRDFDVIYADSVSHHFKYFNVYLQVLAERLRPNGIVITMDPLQTSIPIKIVRLLYRPFQSNRKWEWPFTKATFEQIQEYFKIEAVQGILGYAKWALPIAVISEDYAIGLGKRLHSKDLKESSKLGKGLWRCMQVTMCLRKRF